MALCVAQNGFLSCVTLRARPDIDLIVGNQAFGDVPGRDRRYLNNGTADPFTNVAAPLHQRIQDGHRHRRSWPPQARPARPVSTGSGSESDDHPEARADDVINVGGRKILPREIEEILAGHPAIAECACVGIPDPQGLSGEIISAWRVPKHANATLPGSAELAKLLRRKLEPYKTPRKFQWTDRIPRSSTGKVLRRRLRELK
jgi:hypothetical protein